MAITNIESQYVKNQSGTSAVDEAAPVGTIVAHAKDAAVPTGWFECDGSAVSRSTYSDLFSSISTNYGVGDGSTTFDLPDFAGRFLRGDGGNAEAMYTGQADSLQGHHHGLRINGSTSTSAYDGNAGATGVIPRATSGAADNRAEDAITDGVNGSPRTDTETRAINYAIKWMIKY